MRLSKLFKLSFVGTLIFSPTMAQEADKVHEEALKVLRSQSGDTNRPSSAAAPATSALGAVDSRADRDARIRAETQQRLAERERLQAEKRRQFEDYVKERERLRQQQREHEQGISGQPAKAGAKPDVHNQALEVLRQNPGGTASTVSATPAPASAVPPPASPAPAAVRATPVPVTEAEVAPRVVAPPPASSRGDVHQKALEVLRQTQPAPSTTPAPAPATAPRANPPQTELKPSPELQRRLDEMQRELDAPAPRPGLSAADNDAYVKELEQRALQTRAAGIPAPATSATAATSIKASPAPAVTPALDSKTREMLRQQDTKISQQPAPVSAPATTATLDAAAEARAREILRQQQQAVSTPAATVSAPAPVVPVVSQPIVAQPQPQPVQVSPASVAITPAVPSAVGDIEYSRELEERARLAILERAGAQQAAATPAPEPAPVVQQVDPLAAPLRADPQIDQVHNRAMETLVQVQPGEGAQTQLKNKQERLRALTDLYRADKMTPAEYHQRRAQILAEK